ncbi:MAG: DUF1700 domain-containing protein [Clostridia bacterium]
MNKDGFLNQLSQKLSALDSLERVRMIQYYREIIEDRVEDGLTEEAAVAELEDLDVIAAGILDELMPTQMHTSNADIELPRQKRSMFTIVLLILGAPIWLPLLAGAGAVMISMYAVAWSLIITLFAVVVSLGFGGVAGLIGLVLYIGSHTMTALFILGAGLICTAIGLALFFPVCQFTKWLIAGTVKVGRSAWNAVFHRKERLA